MSDGATPRELLFEACRRNNTTLLTEVFTSPPLTSRETEIATFLNTTTDSLGASALHIAAQCGSYEVLDLILDQAGVEIDGKEKRDGDTPLHKAVAHCNSLAPKEWEYAGKAVLEILLDAGCDPRIRNKARRKPLELVDPRNEACRNILRQSEMTIMAGDDIVNDDEDGVNGPGSESD